MPKLRELPKSDHLSAACKALNSHLYQVIGDSIPKDIKSPELSKPRGRKAMNKTESAYMSILSAMVRRGEIKRVDREGITLRWEDGMTYTADATCYMPDGKIVLIEAKGAWIEGDALVKFRAARANWPMFEFRMMQYKEREWKRVL